MEVVEVGLGFDSFICQEKATVRGAGEESKDRLFTLRQRVKIKARFFADLFVYSLEDFPAVL